MSNYPIAANGGYTGNDNSASDGAVNMKNTQNQVIVASENKAYAVLFILLCVGVWFWRKA
ncbi:hypothetical protein P7F88_19350 [Vibrio hannami]|uniref:hypothetical protein n=1 Tax=Vibrio hannami TaxID=2717094 RepID=UPI00240EED0E|nr:hypothetical protein [Vibrio hannami]MDG3088113.1 hypothetical protein [Vibrio hannami]